MISNVRFSYTTDNLAEFRKLYNLRICYQNNLKFLHKQDLISKNLSNRIVRHSKFIRSYKELKSFFVHSLRINFIDNISLQENFYKFNYKNINFFLEAREKYISMNDLDRCLVWRAKQLNSIFNLKKKEQKKKKIYIYTSRIFFHKPEKRILLAWR